MRLILFLVALVWAAAPGLRLTLELQETTAQVTASWTYDVPPDWTISYVWWVTEEGTGIEVGRDTTGLKQATWQHDRTTEDVAYVFYIDVLRVYGDVTVPTGKWPTTERYVVTARPPYVLLAERWDLTRPDSIPHEAAFEISEGTVWLEFTPDDVVGPQGLWSKDYNGYGAGGHLSIWLEGDSIVFRIQDTAQSYEYRVSGVAGGQRNQVAVQFGPDGFNGYLNGSQVMADPYTGGLVGNDNAIVVAASSMGTAPWEDPLRGTLHTAEFYSGLYDFSGRWGEPPIVPPPSVCDTCISIDVAWLVRTLRWHEDSLVVVAYGSVGQEYACETRWTYTGDPCRPGGQRDVWPVCRRDGEEMEILASGVAACDEVVHLSLPDGSSYEERVDCRPHAAYQRWYESNGNVTLPEECPA